MADTKVSAAADPGTLVATDKVPMARSASTTAYAATVAEIAAFANGAYAPNYAVANPTMDGTAAPGVANTVSRGDHKHPTDTALLNRSGGTMTGALVLAADPAAPLQAATKQYVDGSAPAGGPYVSIANMHDVGRNLIHNPLFNVAQRGVGVFGALNAYALDRWLLAGVADTVNISQVAASDAMRAATGDEAMIFVFNYACGGTAGATAYNNIEQRIESARRLSGKTITISFWAGASAALKLGINLVQVFGTGGSPSAAVFAQTTGQAVTLSGTWTRYSATFAMPSTAGKTFGTNGDDYTGLRFYFSSGANNNASAGSIGVQSGTIQLWGVQLEVGSVATPLEKPDPRFDQSNCERFFQFKAFNYGGYGVTGGGTYASYPLGTRMRATPTVVVTPTTQTNCSGGAAINPLSEAVTPYTVATGTGAYVFAGNFQASADL